MAVSSNEFALNITEIVYYDLLSKRMRIQMYYSVMGLEPSKGFDLIMDEKNKTVAVQSESECKKTDFD